MSLLFQSLQVDILHRLRGRIGRCGSKSLRTCYGGDGCDMTLSHLCKITVRLTYHTCKTETVRLYRSQFDVFLQLAVLLTDTRGIKEQIHTTYFIYKTPQMLYRCFLCHVYRLHSGSPKRVQQIYPASPHAYRPSFCYQQLRDFSTDA